MKMFNEQQNIGKVKHVVNYHDGEEIHKDGSPFFDIAIFKNKRKKDEFVKELLSKGYRKR